MKYIVFGLVALALLGLARIRLAGDDIAVWHVDPVTVVPDADPNHFLMRDGDDADADSPQFDLSAGELAAAFDAYALARPRVTRLAGDPDQLWMTYIQRSKWFGFPDYISVRVIPRQGGAALAIYSRSRYGRSDLGVNKARVKRWVKRLHSITASQAAIAAQ